MGFFNKAFNIAKDIGTIAVSTMTDTANKIQNKKEELERMNDDELLDLQKGYATPGEGYGHFKLTLLDKINKYFEPYIQKREYYMNNPDEVNKLLAYGATKARKIAQTKMKIIRDAVGLNY